MSSTIKGNKPQGLHLQRQQLQNSAREKSQTTNSHINQLKRIKEAVHQSRKEMHALSHANAAVNHISQKNAGAEDSVDNNRLYTRQGRFETVEPETTPSYEEAPEILAEQTGVFGVQDDHFYEVFDRGNEVTEDAFGYYIDAYAPEEEKDSIRVSISNDRAIISGSRKAQNELQESDKKITTNNFQTFREEFTFAQPVISEGMTRERDGDYIRFFIPKLASKINNNT